MQEVLIQKKDNIAEIKLNRPQVSNAFNAALMVQLTQAFNDCSQDKSIRVILLSGMGKNFCAGADLTWMAKASTLTKEANIADADLLYKMYQAMRDCEKPIVALVQGKVFAGGVGLVTACDIAIASSEASFCISEAKVGLVPVVMSPFVMQKLGYSRALELSLTGRSIQAEEALDYGLVNFVVDPKSIDLHAKGDEIVNLLLHQSPNALSEIKKLYDRVPYENWRNSREFLTSLIAKVRAGSEAQEGIKAFLEKRNAAWDAKG